MEITASVMGRANSNTADVHQSKKKLKFRDNHFSTGLTIMAQYCKVRAIMMNLVPLICTFSHRNSQSCHAIPQLGPELAICQGYFWMIHEV